MKDLARFIAGFMDAVGVEKAHIVGHSLGGWIAFFLAIDFPTYVDKLVVVSSGGLAKEAPVAFRLITVPMIGELLVAKVANESFEENLVAQRKNWPDVAVATDELIQLIYEAKDWQAMKKPLLKCFRANGDFFGVKKHTYLPVIQGLSSIKNPLLVIWRRQDALAPVAHTQMIADRCPHARIEIFEGCRHDSMVENLEQFNQLALDFLKD